jgi:dolichol-phosphate mannosyltransferase
MRVSIIVPIYNERNALPKVLSRLKNLRVSWQKEVILSNDGSTDGSEKILKTWQKKRLPLWKFVHLSTNQGKGAAVKAGLKVATGDYVVIFDADGECDECDLDILVQKALAGNFPVVFGTRNSQATSSKIIYWHYSLGVKLLALLINFLYGQNITDPEVGMKLIRRQAINFEITEKGFGQEIEWTTKLAKNSIKIAEVPIHYYPRTYAQGKKLTLLDGLKAIYLVFKFRFVK